MISGSERLPSEFQCDLVALVPHLRAFSQMLCRRSDMADDLVQDTLVKAWAARSRFETGTHLKAWLFTILRNEFYSGLRRSWRQTQWDPEKGNMIPTPANQQYWSAELSDTAHALHNLTPNQRDALILISAGGFSYEEAAKICGTAVGTMKSRVARGRIALSETLSNKTPLKRRALNGTPSEDILAQLSALTPAGARRAAFV